MSATGSPLSPNSTTDEPLVTVKDPPVSNPMSIAREYTVVRVGVTDITRVPAGSTYPLPSAAPVHEATTPDVVPSA